ncbi:MAG: hypothetical protein IPJ97_04675 [Proteobacteria bacterium]|nr:hypothetical protein [Pseudomonadota bacterium]
MALENSSPTSWHWLPEDPAVATTAVEENQTAFEFVQSLAVELSSGRVDLPTCQEVARPPHHALDEDDLSNTLRGARDRVRRRPCGQRACARKIERRRRAMRSH